MHFIVSLVNADRAGADNLGYRASDLGILKEKGFMIPLSFIVSNEAFEEFMGENSLKAKVAAILSEKEPSEAFPLIIALFQQGKMPKEIVDELVEAYESLAVESGSSASNIVSAYEPSPVLLVRSPNYQLPTEDNEGVLQNIKGRMLVVEAIKLVWATAYSPNSIAFRKKQGITDFRMGVIVQKMRKTTQSAEAYSKDEFDDKQLVVKSYSGLVDFDQELMGKDRHCIHSNSLSITKAEINCQEYKIERDFENEDLIKRPLLENSGKQNINDKMLSEIARLTKRAKSFIGRDIKVFYSLRDEYISMLYANRLVFQQRARTQESDELNITIDDSGRGKIEHTHEFQAEKLEPKDELKLPEIMSSDKAKDELLKTAPHKIFTLEGFEPEKKQPEAPKEVMPDESAPKTIVVEATEEAKSAIDEEICIGENLLEQVLKIKDIIERMEEHALNNNKESYTREAKLLKEMLFRARK